MECCICGNEIGIDCKQLQAENARLREALKEIDDAWECPDCHDYYCHECLPESGPICPVCQEKDDAFNEVIDIGHPLYVDDPLGTIARSKKYDRRIQDKREAAMLKADEERGK